MYEDLRYPFGGLLGHQLPDARHREEQHFAWRRRIDPYFATHSVYTGIEPMTLAAINDALDGYYDSSMMLIVLYVSNDLGGNGNQNQEHEGDDGDTKPPPNQA
jgi:hypothetical protein